MHTPPLAGMPRDRQPMPQWATPLIGVAVMLVIALLAWGAPPAGAAVPATTTAAARHVSDAPTYKGWAYIEEYTPQCIANDVTYRLECTSWGDPFVSAWAWTGTQWAQSYLIQGLRVYAWPYAGGWSWVWTQQSGWLAMRADRLLIES